MIDQELLTAPVRAWLDEPVRAELAAAMAAESITVVADDAGVDVAGLLLADGVTVGIDVGDAMITRPRPGYGSTAADIAWRCRVAAVRPETVDDEIAREWGDDA